MMMTNHLARLIVGMATLLKSPYTIIFILSNALLAYWIFSYRAPPGPQRSPRAGSSMTNPCEDAKSNLKYRDYTLEELLPFNGAEREQILLALDQRVYDVTCAKHHYGRGGSYGALAGRDASRSLATHRIIKIKEEAVQAWDDLNDLSEEERKSLNEWVAFFDQKYPRVGTLMPLHAWAGSDNEEYPDPPRGAILENLMTD